MAYKSFNSRRFLFLIFILSIGWHSILTGQILKPVKWEFRTESLAPGEFNLIFEAKMQKGWTVYSQFTDDSGPVPTEIVFEQKENIELIGKGAESGHRKEGFDKLFEVNVIKFIHDQPFTITQKVKLTGEGGVVSGYLTYMTCDDERCLPPTDVDFNFSLSSEIDSKKSINNEKAGGGKSSNSENIEIGNRADDLNKSIQDDPLPTGVSEDIKSEEAVEIIVDEDNLQVNGIGNLEIDIETPLNKENDYQDLKDPTSWEFFTEKINEKKYLLKYKVELEEGWAIYSQFTDDNGPIPTTVNYESKEGIEFVGGAKESGHKKEGVDPLFDVNVIKYLSDTPFEITQQVLLLEEGAKIKGYVDYMVCDNEGCIPLDTDFEFTIGNYISPVVTKEDILENRVKGEYIDQRVPTIVETYLDPLSDCEEGAAVSSSLLWTFIFGFIGGILALLTPCVFPMLPITVSYFLKDNNRSGLSNGLIYGASIIVIYVLLGLLITILLGPEALNRLSTNWIANTAFFLIFVAFAFSFFGFFEITLPSSWTTKSDSMADKGGLIGIFFMAFTLALVSFSCTGPIIGTAIVQAASKGEYIGPFTVMLGFSTALALPFGLFAAFPSWLNTLPRSGSWMNSVKVVLGFLELALALKFLSVADMTNHWGILKYELFMGLWVLIFLGMAAYVFGFLKFPHDSPIDKLSVPRKIFGVSILGLVFYLASGFMIRKDTGNYQALSLMSGIAPPANYNYFLPEPDVDPLIKAKYPSYTKCANNINCFKDYYDGVAYAKENNKPIMLDFTGYGCVNCRKTEEHIWVDEDIRATLNEDVVLISLYVDDDRKLDPILISKNTGEKLRNVGKKWADFQIVNFKQNSQPLYVLVTPDEEVLSSPRPYKEGVKDYNQFLNCGINAFKKSKKQ